MIGRSNVMQSDGDGEGRVIGRANVMAQSAGDREGMVAGRGRRKGKAGSVEPGGVDWMTCGCRKLQ